MLTSRLLQMLRWQSVAFIRDEKQLLISGLKNDQTGVEIYIFISRIELKGKKTSCCKHTIISPSAQLGWFPSRTPAAKKLQASECTSEQVTVIYLQIVSVACETLQETQAIGPKCMSLKNHQSDV